MCLLVPLPESLLFVIRAGQVVYAGLRTGVVPFFESMGFRCPERKAVPDFLQEVNSFKDQAVRVGGFQCRLHRRPAVQEALQRELL